MRKIPEVVQATRSYDQQFGLDALSRIVNEDGDDQTDRNSCCRDPLKCWVYLSQGCDQYT